MLGLLNGLLVEIAQIDSFIATLGTGTVLYALALWYTDGRQIIGVLPRGFTRSTRWQPFGIPIAAFYVLALSRRPLDRHRVPADRPLPLRDRRQSASRGAERHPDPPLHHRRLRRLGPARRLGRRRAGRAKLRIGQASVGLEYLLPALVGAFLGSTTIKPGRVNVWGTIVGVAILAVGISGIQQIGGAFYIEPLFNGVTLLIAIGLAGYAQTPRRAVSRARAQPTARPPRWRRPAGFDDQTKRTIASRPIPRNVEEISHEHASYQRSAAGRFCYHGGPARGGRHGRPTPRTMWRRSRKPNPPWDGPTTGPKAADGKTIVYVSTDQRNGGAHGVGEGVKEAAEKIGWTFALLDGQGSVSGRSTALNQAIASKPDVIVLGGDRCHRAGDRDRGRGQAGHRDRRLACLCEARPARHAADLHQHHHRSAGSGEGRSLLCRCATPTARPAR